MTASTTTNDPLSVEEIRSDFPSLTVPMHGKPLVYLDSAATTLKPRPVLETIQEFYGHRYGTVRRAVYGLSEQATAAFERTRKTVTRFINAPTSRSIVFTKGTTESINLVASSWGKTHLRPGDEVLISAMEHHANIVPWQLACEATGAQLRILPMNSSGELLTEELDTLLNKRTRLVAVTGLSNALGTINPIQEICSRAHAQGSLVLIDAAQMAGHMAIDVQALDCDFLAFSGHKVFGPCGVGVLYGKPEILETMPPYQSGGDMIREVTFEKTTFADIPVRFEAGTPAIVEVIGLGSALEYIHSIGFEQIGAHEKDLLRYGTDLLEQIPKLRLIGTAAHKSSILAFILEDVHAHDIGTILDQAGIAIRAGHHCAQPTMKFFGVAATSRASLSIYNSREDLDALALAIDEVITLFRS
ncbi:MAG: SufS family cysteine desulfurase [Planctomycetota bacterium]|jgi:cysteine desulfurase/selenocysteine lyase|nr:SufS family cysteine desulfurase [Planctomycetota bacterium]